MILNIQALITSQQMTFEENEMVSFEKFHLGTQQTEYMAKVSGTVTKNSNKYIVEGDVRITLTLLCDRCMKTYDYPIHAKLYSVFSSSETDENEDVKPVLKSSIDLSDDILEAIAIEIPMKSLCKQDCKGLCSKCGANLNEETCKCSSTEIDPRLAHLQNIFCQ